MRSDLPISLPEDRLVAIDVLGIDCDQSPADVAVFKIPFKCFVVLALLIITEASSGGTTTAVVKYDKRPTAGDDTSRGDGDIANFILATTAIGKVLYDKAAYGTVLSPGDEVVVQLVTAATGSPKTGHFRPVLLVQYMPEVIANLTDMVETA